MIFYHLFFTRKVLGRIFRFLIFRFTCIGIHTFLFSNLLIDEFSRRFFRINRFIMIILSLRWETSAWNYRFSTFLRTLLSCSVILFILIVLLLGEIINWCWKTIKIFRLRKWLTPFIFSINIHIDLFILITRPCWLSCFRCI